MARNVREFYLLNIYFIPYLFLTCRKIFRDGTDDFSSPTKEVVLRIFIAFMNPSSSAGFEPANIGSNGKHDNQYTTEGDMQSRYSCLWRLPNVIYLLIYLFIYVDIYCT
jgi:hypothetical protein